MKVLVILAAACLATASAAYGGYSGYTGPQASPVVNPNGFLADTPEVAAAKAAHFSEVAKVSSPGYAPGPYNGAPAYNPTPAYNPAPAYNPQYAPAAPVAPYYGNPSVTPQGFLADTPEIAAAKAAHFAEKAKVASKGPEAYDDGSYRPEYDNPSYNAPAPAAPAYNSYQAPAYNGYQAPASYQGYNPQSYAAPAPAGPSHYAGPLASPVVTPQGFLAETPEVAAAKAAHFAEFAKAGSAPAPSHHRYRRSAALIAAPVVAPYTYSYPYYTYPYVHAAPAPAPLSRFAYSVSTW